MQEGRRGGIPRAAADLATFCPCLYLLSSALLGEALYGEAMPCPYQTTFSYLPKVRQVQLGPEAEAAGAWHALPVAETRMPDQA